MDTKKSNSDIPIILHRERRARAAGDELSFEEIMEIVRKRGLKRARKVIDVIETD